MLNYSYTTNIVFLAVYIGWTYMVVTNVYFNNNMCWRNFAKTPFFLSNCIFLKMARHSLEIEGYVVLVRPN